MNAMDMTKELVCINFCFGNNWWCFEAETIIIGNQSLLPKV